MKDQIKFLTAKQVSEYLQIPLRTVHYLSQKGKIRAVKIGHKYRYVKNDIDQYFIYGTDFTEEPQRIPNSFIERRVYSRINANIKCQYSITLPPFKNINKVGIVKNIGTGGIFLFDQNGEVNEVAIDDPIHLQFQLISDSFQRIFIKTKGKIVWKDREGMGIKFKIIDRGIKDILLEYTS